MGLYGINKYRNILQYPVIWLCSISPNIWYVSNPLAYVPLDPVNGILRDTNKKRVRSTKHKKTSKSKAACFKEE